jgi:hypothetical protein
MALFGDTSPSVHRKWQLLILFPECLYQLGPAHAGPSILSRLTHKFLQAPSQSVFGIGADCAIVAKEMTDLGRAE